MRGLDVLGTAEAAEVLGIDKNSVSRLIRNGGLKPDAQLACGSIFRRSTIEKAKRDRAR